MLGSASPTTASSYFIRQAEGPTNFKYFHTADGF